LYQYVFNNEQETAEISLSAIVDLPLIPPPLSEALTLEAYESEQARLREIEEQERLEKDRKRREERSAGWFG
jgi:hypothetical protein